MSHISPAFGYISSTGAAVSSGAVGEFISSVVTFASPVSLSNGGKVNVTSVLLTAGVWDVSGFLGIYNTVATFPIPIFKYAIGAISIVPGNFSWDDGPACPVLNNSATTYNGMANKPVSMALPIRRVIVAAGSTQSVYLVAQALLTESPTIKTYGKLQATRRA